MNASPWETAKVVVAGDFRTFGGEYRPARHEIIISGGVGLLWFADWHIERAIQCWLADIEAIAEVERRTGGVYPRGFFYMLLRDAYAQLPVPDNEQARYWQEKARADDVKIYGRKKALGFPAWTVPLP